MKNKVKMKNFKKLKIKLPRKQRNKIIKKLKLIKKKPKIKVKNMV